MARFADRIAYRLAGLVWTALYAGLCRGAARTATTVTTLTGEAASYDRADAHSPQPAFAA